MFQRVISTLKKRELFTPTLFVLALLIILSLIIILGQFFHQSLQDEMAGQFNQQQLLLAREVAMNIDSFIDHSFKDILLISRMPEFQMSNHGGGYSRVVDAVNLNMQNEALVTVSVLDKRGFIIYDSAFSKRLGKDLSKTDYFQKARLLPKNEKLITDLLTAPDPKPEAKQFIIATPIYQQLSGSAVSDFRGVVLAVFSLEGITHKYIEPIKSGTRGYAWMMDSAGTLLFHPKQPQMVGKNLYQTDRSCFECHRSFDTEKKMIEGTTEMFGSYEAPGGENKLAAYYKFPVARR
jgi:hypothetical protein